MELSSEYLEKISSCSTISIPTPTSQRPLEEYSHIYKTPPRTDRDKDIITASPPNFSNIVLVTKHNSNLNLSVLFNIVPIVKISPEEIEKSKFNFDQIFTSVRKYPKARGWRSESKIKSFLDLDFYYKNNGFHLKVSKDKITIVGGKSSKISEEMIKVIYKHFEYMNDKWVEYKDISDEDKNEIMSLYEANKPLDKDNKHYSFYEYLDNIIDREEDDVEDRLRDIFPIVGVPLFERPPVFTNLVNCNLVYNYRLPPPVLVLKDKANKLRDLGYEVSYDNVAFVKQFIAKWIDKEHNDSFTFTIQTIGSIKQNTSSTHERSIEMYEKIVRDLGYKPFTPGIPYATKNLNKKNIEITKKTEDFLDKYFKL